MIALKNLRKETSASSNEGHIDERQSITEVTDIFDFTDKEGYANFCEINSKTKSLSLEDV